MTVPLLVAFDLETTGLNPVNDRILTACVVGDPRVDTLLLLNPGIPIPAEATAIHGIRDADVADGMDYRDGLRALGDALSTAWQLGATVVGHNILGYDLAVLRMQERVMFGTSRTEFGPVFDTCTEYRNRFPGNPGSLIAACDRLGVPLVNAHDAASDAAASLELARALMA